MQNQAVEVMVRSSLSDSMKVDSSLVLINQALEYDDENFWALSHKRSLLVQKRDLKNVIKVSERMCELSDHPEFLADLAVFQGFARDTIASLSNFSKALDGFDALLAEDPCNFDLRLSLIQAKQMMGMDIAYSTLLDDLKNCELKEGQNEMLNYFVGSKSSHWAMQKYWDGELSYEDLKYGLEKL